MSIENTADRDPVLHLLGGLAGMDDYIGGMEAQGQQQFVHSDRLPAIVHGGTDEDYIALGFSFGEVDPQDRLFRPATLPEGWTKQRTDHSMWSKVYDANGRARVEVFYKAAFYDRDAFMRLRTIHSEVYEALNGAKLVVDEWTTREAWVEALTERRDRDLKEASEMESYYPEGAQRRREQVAKCDKLLAKLAVSR